MADIMPRRSKLKLPPLDLGKETLGGRIARLRKERGLTQVELASKIGIIQALVSDYERGKLRPHPEMIVRLACALGVSTDTVLGVVGGRNGERKPSLRILRRLQAIESLPATQQRILLKTIDTFIKAAEG